MIYRHFKNAYIINAILKYLGFYIEFMEFRYKLFYSNK